MSNNYKNYDEDGELIYLVSDNNEEANEVLYKKYSKVIDFYVKKYLHLVESTGLDYNDLYQEGLLGLVSAINKYSTHKDIKFSTFAFICIKRKIITAVKIANRKKHSILNESFSLDYKNEDGKETLENLISSSEEGIEDLLIYKENETYLRQKANDLLTDFEKMVYELRLNGFSYDEISKTLDKSYKSIESALFRIKGKLKKIMSEIV